MWHVPLALGRKLRPKAILYEQNPECDWLPEQAR